MMNERDLYKAGHNAGAKKCDSKRWWVRFPLEEMRKFIFSFLRSGVENMEFLQYSAETGDQSVLTICSLCLPCCVRDTAWSRFVIYKSGKTYMKLIVNNIQFWWFLWNITKYKFLLPAKFKVSPLGPREFLAPTPLKCIVLSFGYK